MTPLKIAGLVLILAGALGLVYGGFSYTRQTDELRIGPLQLSVREKQTVNVPLWAGLAAVAAGAGLLLVSRKS